MKLWTITLCHNPIEQISVGMHAYYSTTILPSTTHILVDHHWPIDYWAHRRRLLELAEQYSCYLMTPYENLGGHEGYNWVLRNLPLENDDLVIGYDGDSYPITPKWDMAFLQVMEDPSLAACSLNLKYLDSLRPWKKTDDANGIEVVLPAGDNENEMFNVTIWRYSFLKENGLFQALCPFYGHVEIPMQNLIRKKGFRHVYLKNYFEDHNPIPNNSDYVGWKDAHVRGKFLGNFKNWVQRGTR